MKRSLLVCLGMGVGWLLAVTLLLVVMPYGDGYSVGEILGNYFVLGFPGIMLFLIAIILSLIYPEGLEGDEY